MISRQDFQSDFLDLLEDYGFSVPAERRAAVWYRKLCGFRFETLTNCLDRLAEIDAPKALKLYHVTAACYDMEPEKAAKDAKSEALKKTGEQTQSARFHRAPESYCKAYDAVKRRLEQAYRRRLEAEGEPVPEKREPRQERTPEAIMHNTAEALTESRKLQGKTPPTAKEIISLAARLARNSHHLGSISEVELADILAVFRDEYRKYPDEPTAGLPKNSELFALYALDIPSIGSGSTQEANDYVLATNGSLNNL